MIKALLEGGSSYTSSSQEEVVQIVEWFRKAAESKKCLWGITKEEESLIAKQNLRGDKNMQEEKSACAKFDWIRCTWKYKKLSVSVV